MVVLLCFSVVCSQHRDAVFPSKSIVRGVAKVVFVLLFLGVDGFCRFSIKEMYRKIQYALSRVIHRIQSEMLFRNPDWYMVTVDRQYIRLIISS